MIIKELISQLQNLNPEDKVEFVGLVEYGFGETMSFETEEIHIQSHEGLTQLIIQGEEN